MKKDNCELCDLERKTRWYYEDDDFIICDCQTCKIPMVVFKEHTMTVPPGAVLHALRVLLGEFGQDFQIRFSQKEASNHLHWHILIGGQNA